MATLKTLVEQINKMEAEVKNLKTENLLIRKQLKEGKEEPNDKQVIKDHMTADQINKMICDKIKAIVKIDFITNLYRNK